MAENEKNKKESPSIVDEIEQQLQDILKQKKDSVEKELQEKIEREKQEAEKKMKEIEQELAKEKEALVSYQSLLSEFETNKVDIKKQIKENLDKVAEIQKDIEAKTASTLDLLNQVQEFNQKLEVLTKDTYEKATAMKDDLQEKYGIVATVPESEEEEDVRSHLEKELDRLNKIKELLSSGDSLEISTEKNETAPVFEKEEKPAEKAEEKAEEKPVEEAKDKATEEEVPERETEIIPLEADAKKEEEKKEEAAEEKAPAVNGLKEEKDDLKMLDTLEKYRKSEGEEGEGEVSYFENEDKRTLDGEYIIAALTNSVDEAKKLYVKLSQTESPKEQFFVKQEIIQHQEAVRKLMLTCIRMCEKDPEFLPKFTEEILNPDVFKSALEKVSMENWSNQEDFTSFDEYAKELKDSFYAKITPPAKYLQSIIEELKINTG